MPNSTRSSGATRRHARDASSTASRCARNRSCSSTGPRTRPGACHVIRFPCNDPARPDDAPKTCPSVRRWGGMCHMIRFPCNGPTPCRTCSRPTLEPRRGECFACYQRGRRGHVPEGVCVVCGATDRRMLRRTLLLQPLGDARHETLCANHAAVVGRRTLSLEELRAELSAPGDRRQEDRRAGERRAPAPRRARADVRHLVAEPDARTGDGRREADRCAWEGAA